MTWCLSSANDFVISLPTLIALPIKKLSMCVMMISIVQMTTDLNFFAPIWYR